MNPSLGTLLYFISYLFALLVSLVLQAGPWVLFGYRLHLAKRFFTWVGRPATVCHIYL